MASIAIYCGRLELASEESEQENATGMRCRVSLIDTFC